MPVSSPSTEESVSAFIERTVSSLEPPTQEIELMDLPTPSPARVTTTSHAGLLKVSVSEPIVVNQDFSTEKSAADDNAETTSQLRTGPLYADTSDVEDWLDSSGVDAFPPSPLPWPGTQLLSLNLKGSSETRPAIVTLNTSSTELELPAGHTTVAFNEDQIHTILRTIADESVISFYHMMNSLLPHATSGVPQNKKKRVCHDVVPPRLAQCMTVQGMKVVLEHILLTVILVGHSIKMKILVSWVPFQELTAQVSLIPQ